MTSSPGAEFTGASFYGPCGNKQKYGAIKIKGQGLTVN